MIDDRGKTYTRTDQVLFDVALERVEQNRKWGEQNHPDGTGPDHLFLGSDHVELSFYAREECQRKAADGSVTWFDILLEEVFEAGAEEELPSLRTELVQTAAVIVAWIEAIDRRAR